VLDSASFGVPQERERFFMIAHREGREFTFPSVTHGPPRPRGAARQLALEEPPRLEPWSTAWDALGDLVDDDDPSLRVTGKWADLLPTIPEGENYLHHTERGAGRPLFGWRRRFWSFLLKLAKDRPSWTITAQPGPAIGPFHWKSRRLSMRELARLQTFPDDVRILGSQASILKQAGNAVPSALAEMLGRAIRRQLLGESRLSLRPTLCPPVRRPIPPAEPPAGIPRRFLSLEGAHAPHPGTGLGYGALARIASR
jgi:DNA (cytosine-5)-methyltransferase 1